MNVFIAKENVDLIWEILSDEPILKNISNARQKIVYNALNKNINNFYNKEKDKPFDLVRLNKGFLTETLKILRTNKTSPIEKYKVEDIHAERKILFDEELLSKQKDFQESMIKKPLTPDFTEKIDEKIQSMDELIAKTVAQRNFDISQFQPSSNGDDWLKPQETSINISQKKPEFKHIKIEQNIDNGIIKKDIIDLSKLSKANKQISWSNKDDVQYFNTEERQTDVNILTKLKKVDPLQKLINEQMLFKERIEHLESKNEKLTLSIEKILQILKK